MEPIQILVIDDDKKKLAQSASIAREIFPQAEVKERLVGFNEELTRYSLAEYISLENPSVVILDNSLGSVLGGSAAGTLRMLIGLDHPMEVVMNTNDVARWKGSPLAATFKRFRWSYGATNMQELRETLVELKRDKFEGK